MTTTCTILIILSYIHLFIKSAKLGIIQAYNYTGVFVGGRTRNQSLVTQCMEYNAPRGAGDMLPQEMNFRSSKIAKLLEPQKVGS